jgi:hypothetical protein
MIARRIAPYLFVLLVVAAPAAAISDYSQAQYRLLAGPECITDAGRIVAQEAPVPPNLTFLRVRHMGDPGTLARLWQVAWPVGWDVGEVTGLRPPQPVVRWQRGYLDLGLPSGTNAFQVHCTAAGFMINTWSFPHDVPVVGGGPHAVLERRFDPPLPLWTRPGAELTLQLDAQVPWIHSPGDGVAQLNIVYYLRHATRGNSHAHVIALWDSRADLAGSLAEFVANDTFTSFASTPLVDRLADGSRPRYASRSPYSAPLALGAGWRGPRFLRAHVSREQAAAMLADAARADAAIDPDVAHWQLESALVFLEVVVGTGAAGNLSVGASVRDFMVLEGSDP